MILKKKNTVIDNTGENNSGYGNSGNWNSGAFCTIEPTALFFNKPTTFKLSEFIFSDAWPDFSDMNPCVWIEESMMTDEEKKEYPSHKTTGGYIKKLDYKQAWSIWKRKCSDDNWQKVLNLPNFDADIWKEITGIDVETNDASKKKATELRKKADELLKHATELEQSL